MKRLLPLSWLVLLLLPSILPLAAAEPEIRNLDIHGLQVGGATKLVIDGDDLGKTPRLLLPFAAKQQLQPNSTDKRAAFEVTLAADVTPGYYPLRVVTGGGVSLPVVIGVDRLPQLPVAETIEQVPVALHGTVNGSTTVETKFPGKAGQKVFVEVEAQRLGSRLRPIVHVYSPKRLQLGWSWPTLALGNDARLEVTLPEDGVYTVSVHDLEYAAGSPGFFRLKIGQWSFIDQVFPPVIGKGQQAVELIGSGSPIPSPLPFALKGGAENVLPLAWPKDGLWSGPRPFVLISGAPELVEQAAAEKGQEIPAGPVGVCGKLARPFEEDRYRIPVTPGAKFRFEVFAERLGSPVYAAVAIRNDMGGILARGVDSPGTLDPVLDFTVPDKVTSVLVAVADIEGRGSPRGIYRLVVTPQTPAVPKMAYRLNTPAQRVTLAQGGRVVVPVLIERDGYQGGVELAAEGLPSGVKLENVSIPAGADGALVTVQRGDALGDAAFTSWRGRSQDGQERIVTLKGHPLEKLQPWLATDLPVAPAISKAADFQVDWRGLPADAGLVLAGKLALPVKLVRLESPATANSVVRLTLLTSQLPPLVNNQPDPNQTLRVERPVELAAKVLEGSLTVLVPPQLAGPVYDVTVQAELIAADRRTVLATAYAPVRRMTVRQPLIVQVDGTGRLDAKLDPKTGATVEVKGKVERREGLVSDVALTITGLPAGVRADPVTVKAGVTAFVVKVVLPPNAAVGEVKGLKLSGTAAPDPAQPNRRVKSKDVELTLVVSK